VSGRGRLVVARLLVLTTAASFPLVVPLGAAAGPGDIATYAGGVGEGRPPSCGRSPSMWRPPEPMSRLAIRLWQSFA
jgi:hypothetical protein